jgi:hypothetical protein
MPDGPSTQDVEITPGGTSANIPSWLSPADQEALKHDLGLPAGSNEWKQAAQKWKKKANDLKKAAKQLRDTAGTAAAESKADAQNMADDAEQRATDLQGTVLKGFGGKLTITRVLIGVAVIVTVVIVLVAAGGGGAKNATDKGAGGTGVGTEKKDKKPKASIAWSSKVVADTGGANCQTATTVRFVIIDNGPSFAGKTAVVKETGMNNDTKSVAVGADGSFEVTFVRTLQPAGPARCSSTDSFTLVSVGGNTNLAATASQP